MKFSRLLVLGAELLLSIATVAQQIGKPLAVWQTGQLDIHHINTGQGNATFIVFPDGTNLLIDAGAINTIDWRTNKPRNIPVKPGNDRQAGEWIARYVRNALRFQADPVINYAIITHFHDDHMGSPLNVIKRGAGGYVLTGITEVGEHIPIRKVIDRGWPDYAYPRSFASDSMVVNYHRFLDWQINHKGLIVEQFQAGRNDQIASVKQPELRKKYPFEVRNLAVNGQIWTGDGSKTRPLFPDLTSLPATEYPNENMCSIALQIRYGNFDYFSGGDIQGVLQFGSPVWHDVETPLAKVVGPVDVQLLDHHGYADSQNGALLASLRPRVFVIPAWASSHPGRDVLERIFSEKTYTGERDVFATNLLEESKLAIGDLLPRLKSQSGHVVVRVENGGKSYRVLVLDDNDELFSVKAIHGPYQAQ
ncbi:ComEC/Rec2 family competence protein [Spirosoma flavum]|uniref:ComEC/Rec2 family competence protein n=1 Tax=Spirosoma flavum TaxID=2048557 RepID=A0ABW6AIC1_9BACT